MFGMDGLSDPESVDYNGELTLVASPPEQLRPFLGEGGVRLVRLFLARIRDAVRTHFDEDRPLFLSGALLTRLQPPPQRSAAQRQSGGGGTYEYSIAHVDRANVASYDYSAVLYLNSKGGGFEGGDFRFVDATNDEVLEPRAGRCVLFPSGFENLHRVCAVSKGTRYALAAWLTLTEAAADGPHREGSADVVEDSMRTRIALLDAHAAAHRRDESRAPQSPTAPRASRRLRGTRLFRCGDGLTKQGRGGVSKQGHFPSLRLRGGEPRDHGGLANGEVGAGV